MFCATYNALLDRNCHASARYFETTCRLMMLVGKGKTASFEGARRDCKMCLENCRRTAAALHAHQAAHGC